MDPVAFFSWLGSSVSSILSCEKKMVTRGLRLMGYLHRKAKDKKGNSLIHDVFQGEVQVGTTQSKLTSKAKKKNGSTSCDES